MGREWKIRENDEWFEAAREDYPIACCDCGLVHRLDFKIVKGKLMIRARRDERSTAARRVWLKRKGKKINA